MSRCFKHAQIIAQQHDAGSPKDQRLHVDPIELFRTVGLFKGIAPCETSSVCCWIYTGFR